MKLFFKILIIFLSIIGIAILIFYYLYVQEDWFKASSTVDSSKYNDSWIASYKMEPDSVFYNDIVYRFDTVWEEHPRHVKLFASGRSSRSRVDKIYALNLSRADTIKGYLGFQLNPVGLEKGHLNIFTDGNMQSLAFKSQLPDFFIFTCSDFEKNIVFDTIHFYKIINTIK